MNNEEKTIETIEYNIDSINRYLERKIADIKECTKYLNTEDWTKYH